MKHLLSHTPFCRLVSALALLASASAALQAGTPQAEKNPVIEEAPPPSALHALLQLDISDHYITPRGLNVENEGVVFQPLFLVFADLYSNKAAFLSSISATAGVWSSIHSNESGADPGHWNEFDPIFGLTFKFAKQLKFDATYTSFVSMVDSYPTSHHLELKLSLDDSPWLGAFALNPFVAYWQELANKATVTFNQATSQSSYYFTLGIDPTVKLGKAKLEFPTFLNLVDSDFYQKMDGTPGGSGLALICTGAKLSIPMSFVPKQYGFWTFYAGVKYYHLENEGLLQGNLVLTPNEHRRNLVQFHGGISIFF